ncbi:propanediol utilization protein PduL [Klebsiella michiganensis]|nr:propanediol utilization protein PduL [Klebsiella michiganensis]
MDKQLLESTVSKVLDEMRLRPIPLGVSNRHIHLSAADYERLFPGHPISEKKALLQPGQYAAEQTVTLVGPKGQLKNVRLLGPLRSVSQVEISRTDARTLGVAAPLRMSGDLKGTPASAWSALLASWSWRQGLSSRSGIFICRRSMR